MHREEAHQVNNQMKNSFGISRKTNTKNRKSLYLELPAEQINIDQKITAALAHEDKTKKIFLQTAIVPVIVKGEIVYLRATHSNLVTEAAVQRHHLRRKTNNNRVFELGGNEVSANRGLNDLCLPPKNKAPIIIYAAVLTKMTNDLPSRYINIDHWGTVKDLQLADLDFKSSPKLTSSLELDTTKI